MALHHCTLFSAKVISVFNHVDIFPAPLFVMASSRWAMEFLNVQLQDIVKASSSPEPWWFLASESFYKLTHIAFRPHHYGSLLAYSAPNTWFSYDLSSHAWALFQSFEFSFLCFLPGTPSPLRHAGQPTTLPVSSYPGRSLHLRDMWIECGERNPYFQGFFKSIDHSKDVSPVLEITSAL